MLACSTPRILPRLTAERMRSNKPLRNPNQMKIAIVLRMPSVMYSGVAAIPRRRVANARPIRTNVMKIGLCSKATRSSSNSVFDLATICAMVLLKTMSAILPSRIKTSASAAACR